jgi:Fe-S cluster assembly ATPase SufC
MQDGEIAKTGSAELAKELEDKRYEWLQWLLQPKKQTCF